MCAAIPNSPCPSASCRAAPRCPQPSQGSHQLLPLQGGAGLAQAVVCLLLWWLARAVSKSRENKLNTSGPVFVFLQSNIRRRVWGIWGLLRDGVCAFGFPALALGAQPPLHAGGVWTVCVCFWLAVHLPCSVPSCAETPTPWPWSGEQEGVTAPVHGVFMATATSGQTALVQSHGAASGCASFQDSLQTSPKKGEDSGLPGPCLSPCCSASETCWQPGPG